MNEVLTSDAHEAPQTTAGSSRATFGQRVAARLIDGVIFTIIDVIIIGVCFAITAAQPTVGSVLVSIAIFMIVPLIPITLGYVLGEGGAAGATVGKALMNIRVVRLGTGQRIGYAAAVGRFIVQGLDIFLGASSLAMLIRADKRTLADAATGTEVIPSATSRAAAAKTLAISSIAIALIAWLLAGLSTIVGPGLNDEPTSNSPGTADSVGIDGDPAIEGAADAESAVREGIEAALKGDCRRATELSPGSFSLKDCASENLASFLDDIELGVQDGWTTNVIAAGAVFVAVDTASGWYFIPPGLQESDTLHDSTGDSPREALDAYQGTFAAKADLTWNLVASDAFQAIGKIDAVEGDPVYLIFKRLDDGRWVYLAQSSVEPPH